MLKRCVIVLLLAGCTPEQIGPPPQDQVPPPPTIALTQPADGATVPSGDLLVQGTAGGSIASVTVALDGSAPAAASGTTSFTATLAVAPGEHQLVATATDTLGRTAQASVHITATGAIDSTPPTLELGDLEDGLTVSPGPVALQGQAGDAALSRVEVSVDGGPFVAATGLESWTFSWDATDATSGEHPIVIAAVDASGNRTERTITVTVDATPDTADPVVTIATPAEGSQHRTEVLLSGTATDDRGVTRVEVSTDGTTFQAAAGTSSWTYSLAVGALVDGEVSVTVRALDAAGNDGTSVRRFVLDRQAPVATLEGLPANITAASSLAVTVGGADVARYRYQLDGGTWQGPFEVATQAVIAASALGDGPHTLAVVGADAAGNWQAEGEATSHGWVVDRLNPIAELTGTPAGSTWRTGFSIVVGGANVVAYRYELNGAASASDIPVTMPISLSGLADGPYTLTVWGRNSAGTEQTLPTSRSWTVDTAAPTLAVTPLSPESPTKAAATTFSVGASEPATIVWTVTRTGSGCTNSSGSAVGISASIDIDHTLCDGSYRLVVYATDAAGNESSAESRTYQVDRTPPAFSLTPATPPALTRAASSTFGASTSPGENVTFSWTVTRQGAGCSDSAGTWAGPSATITVNNTLCDGLYTLTVSATDATGNTSEAATRSYEVDRTAPAFTLTPASVTGPSNAASRTFTAATSPSETATFSWTLTRSGTGCTNSTGSSTGTSADIDVDQTVCDGSYTLSVAASDSIGNNATTVSRTWTVDRTAPSLTLSAAPAGTTKAPSVTFTATSSSGVVTFDWTVRRIGAGCSDSTGTFVGTSASIVVASSCDGNYRLEVTTRDAAGNVSTPATGTYSVDRTAPAFSLAPLTPTSPSNAASATFTATTMPSESVAFSWTVTRTGTGCSNSSGSSSGVAADIAVDQTVCNGSYTLSVTASDSTTNVSPATTRTWTVDRAAPTFTLSAAPAAPTNADSTSFTASTSPVESASFAWTVTRTGSGCSDSSGSATGSSTTIVVDNTLCDGSYTLSVSATDALGNPSAAVSRSYTVARNGPAFTLTPDPAPGPTNAATTTFTATTSPAQSVDFTWTIDRQGTDCYDTSGSFTGTGTSIVVDNLICNGTYVVTVVATSGAASTTLTRTYVVDRKVPNLSLNPINPTNPTNAASTSFTATAMPVESVTFNWTVTRTGAGCSNSSGSFTGTLANIEVDNAVCDGTYVVAVTATDAAGNSTPPSSRVYQVDRTAPAFTLAPATPVSPTGAATTTFTATTDPSESVAFDWTVTRVGAGCTSSSGTASGFSASFDVVNSVCQGDYTVAVTARDALGNTSAPTIRSYVVTVSAPTGVAEFWGGPHDGAAWPTRSATAEWVVKRPSADVTHYRYTLSGATVAGAAEGAFTGEFARLRLTGLAEGTTTVTVCLGNAFGLYQTACGTTRSVTVDRTPPAPPTITAGPAQDAFVRDWVPTFTFGLPAGSALKYQVYDSVGRLFDRGYGEGTTVALPALTDGDYTLSASAVDPAGNSSAALSRSFKVRRSPPMFTFATAPSRYTTSGTVSATLSANASATTYRYRLNGGAWSPNQTLATAISTSVTGYGWQSLVAETTDAAGNTVQREYRWFRGAATTTGSFGVYYVKPTASGGNDTSACTTAASACATIAGALNKGTELNRVIHIFGPSYTLSTTVARPGYAFTLVGGWDVSFATRSGYSLLTGNTLHQDLVSCTAAGCGLIGIETGGTGSGRNYYSVAASNLADCKFGRSAGTEVGGASYVDGNTFLGTSGVGLTFDANPPADSVASVVNNTFTTTGSSTFATGLQVKTGFAPTETGLRRLVIVNNSFKTSQRAIYVTNLISPRTHHQMSWLVADNTVTTSSIGLDSLEGGLRLMLYRNTLGTAAEPLLSQYDLPYAAGATTNAGTTYDPVNDTWVAALANTVRIARGGGSPRCYPAGLDGPTFAHDNQIVINSAAGSGCGTADSADGLRAVSLAAAGNSITIGASKTASGLYTSDGATFVQNVISVAGSSSAAPSKGHSSGMLNRFIGNQIVADQCFASQLATSGAPVRVADNTLSCRVSGGTLTGAAGADHLLDFSGNSVSSTGTTADLSFNELGRVAISGNVFQQVGLRLNPSLSGAPEADAAVLVERNEFILDAGIAVGVQGGGGTNAHRISFNDNAIYAPTGLALDGTAVVGQVVGNTFVSDSPVRANVPIGTLASNLFVNRSAGIGGSAVFFAGAPWAPSQAFANSYGRYSYALSRMSGSYAGCAGGGMGCTVAEIAGTNEGADATEAALLAPAGVNLRPSSANPCAILSGGLQVEQVLPASAPATLVRRRLFDFDDNPRTVDVGPAGCPAGVTRGYVEYD